MSTVAVIGPFRGRYRFLSNFWDKHGKPSEHFFQAAKTTDKEARALILAAPTAGEAKRLGRPDGFLELSEKLGREVSLRPDWESIKFDVMAWCLERKFQHPELRQMLLDTGDAELVELNTWNDLVWGRCTCAKHQGEGENNLGRLLMELRDKLRAATLDE